MRMGRDRRIHPRKQSAMLKYREALRKNTCSFMHTLLDDVVGAEYADYARFIQQTTHADADTSILPTNTTDWH